VKDKESAKISQINLYRENEDKRERDRETERERDRYTDRQRDKRVCGREREGDYLKRPTEKE
jgi:hypothetical protein